MNAWDINSKFTGNKKNDQKLRKSEKSLLSFHNPCGIDMVDVNELIEYSWPS